MNSVLDSSIYVNYCELKPNHFHSRFEVKQKVYEYKINLGTYDPIINDYYNYNRPLNINKMKKPVSIYWVIILMKHMYVVKEIIIIQLSLQLK